MVESKSDQQIGYILRSYPRLSQTFILNEILALENAGQALAVFAITNPHEPVAQADVTRVRAAVDYLDQEQPGAAARVMRRYGPGYLRALAYVLLHPVLDQGYIASRRTECFRQAVRLVDRLACQQQMGRPVTHLHAHFAHDPALIALLVHTMTGISFSFTAHARDLFQTPRSVLRDRIRAARAVITCCKANLDYLEQINLAERWKYHLVYHGVNLQGFQPAMQAARQENTVPLILSVGRLIEKKGFLDLFQALRQVKETGGRFHCAVYGEGPLAAELARWIDEHGLAGDITLEGGCTQEELFPIYQQADFFALTPFITDDGDRDGIPNVLVEAMAAGLPVISTRVAGIPELVAHGHNGLLISPHDPDKIAAAILTLLQNPAERRRMGVAARRTAERFDVNQSAARLKDLFAWLVRPEEQIVDAERYGEIAAGQADLIAVTGREPGNQ